MIPLAHLLTANCLLSFHRILNKLAIMMTLTHDLMIPSRFGDKRQKLELLKKPLPRCYMGPNKPGINPLVPDVL